MLDDLVKEYLSLSDIMRKGYKDSLRTESQTWNDKISLRPHTANNKGEYT